jgi:predicted DNA-binding transcriptional regulator AlpA
MRPRTLTRLKQAYGCLGCGKTKFYQDYRLNDPAEPYVPGTTIPRLRPIHLGPRNIGFLGSEIDDLIDALAALRPVVPQLK